MTLRPDQRQIASGMLRTILVTVASPVDHLRVIIISLSIYLMAQVLLVNRRIVGHYLRPIVALKAFHVLIVPWSHYSLFWILRRYVVILVSLS